MTCDNVRGPVVGTMFVSARKLSRAAAEICVGLWLSSRFRAFTNAKWAMMPFLYAVMAVP